MADEKKAELSGQGSMSDLPDDDAKGVEQDDDDPAPAVPIPGAAPVAPALVRSKMLKTFCPNIKEGNVTPTAVEDALVVMKTKDTGYVQCAGTTTIFGAKDCVHRQCHCITRNAPQTYPADPEIFSKAELTTLASQKKLAKKYQICHRHIPSLRIPFEYLTVLELEKSTMDETIRGGIVRIRGLAGFSDNQEFDILLKNLGSLIPYLSEMSRQDAATSRAGLKRALDGLTAANSTERPLKVQKLQRAYKQVIDLIGEENIVHIDTTFGESPIEEDEQ
jgi:hypothetical protein